MNHRSKHLSQGAMIAALYFTLTHLQNMLLPGSTSWMIQVRLSEALCVLALFTPAAVPGLSLGCLFFSLTSSAALPMDFFFGTLATFLGAQGMGLCRRMQAGFRLLPGLLIPIVSNALLVGWELTIWTGSPFWMSALYVAAGEAVALGVFGTALHWVLVRWKLGLRMFGK